MASRASSAEKIASRTRSLVGRVPERGTARVSEPANPAMMRVMLPAAYRRGRAASCPRGGPGGAAMMEGWMTRPTRCPPNRPDHRGDEQQMIDRLWDFSDPAASEERFREAADDDEHPAHVRAVMTTQLARALGIQGRFAEAIDVLDGVVAGGIPSDDPERDVAEVRARVDDRARPHPGRRPTGVAESVPVLTRGGARGRAGRFAVPRARRAAHARPERRGARGGVGRRGLRRARRLPRPPRAAVGRRPAQQPRLDHARRRPRRGGARASSSRPSRPPTCTARPSSSTSPAGRSPDACARSAAPTRRSTCSASSPARDPTTRTCRRSSPR